MQRSYDVVIIGGGVIGSSIAYHLSANPGFTGRIAVVERDPTYAASSSSLSTSAIRQQFATPANIRMSEYSIGFLRGVREALSVEGYEADIGLRERSFGVFEGLTYQEIQQRWPEQGERWRRRDPDFGAEGGETLRDFYARCVGTATRLAAAHPGQNIALIAHGGVMDCLYRAALGVALDAPRSWQLGNASINRVLYSPQGFTLVGWSDTHHLEGGCQDSPLDEGSDGITTRAT